MKKTPILKILIILLAPVSVIAEPTKYSKDLICPEFVEAEMKFSVNAPQGWKSSFEPRPRYYLEHAIFYDGPPERNSSIMPDQGGKGGDFRWKELGGISKNRGVWIGCFYTGGLIQLSKQLPVTTNECRLKRDQNRFIGAHNFITSIQCK